jgi:putative FmdB family regulatory protein
MPTYRYRCQECGEEFEQWQSITADPLRTHDHGCGGGLVKVMTPAGIVLKGSGFYKTDNRSGSKRREGGGDKRGDKSDKSEKSDKSDSKSDSSSGSKDAAKPDSKTPSSSSSDGKSSTGAAAS